MKEIKIDAAIVRDAELSKLVQDVTRLLEREIGPEASEITAKWSIFDPEFPVERSVRLEISDEFDRSSTVFSERSLRLIAEYERHISLSRIWGDLLQERSHRQARKLKLLIQNLQDQT